MSIWAEIKKSLNSTLGTSSFKSLDKIVTDLIGATGNTGGSATAGTVMAKLNAIVTETAKSTSASNSGTLSQKLTYIISTLIGATGATGGTATAGTVMAKLNAIITNTNTTVSNHNTLAKNYVFVEGSTVLHTQTFSSYNWSGTYTADYTVIGYMTPAYSGAVTLNVKTHSSNATGGLDIRVVNVDTGNEVVQKEYTTTASKTYATKVPVIANNQYKIQMRSTTTNNTAVKQWSVTGNLAVPSNFTAINSLS